MNILVTGGAGFIGTNLIKRLLRDGHYVESIDNYETGFVENEIDSCVYNSLDIDAMDWFDGKGLDICFHLAALPRIQPSFKNPSETFRVNTVGTQKVLNWAMKNNVKLIYAGSSSRWHDPHQSPYALSKYLGEELCHMYRRVYNVDVHIARFYNVYGPYEVLEGDNAAVIGKWRTQVKNNQPITIVGDGDQRRDFTHVDDIVDGLIRISKYSNNDVYEWELGTGNNYSMNEVYQIFKDKFDATCEYIEDQNGNYRETRRVNTTALDLLGWKPTDRLKEYIMGLYNPVKKGV
jgi:UDP-glucose 4-epimerase